MSSTTAAMWFGLPTGVHAIAMIDFRLLCRIWPTDITLASAGSRCFNASCSVTWVPLGFSASCTH
eukprot:5838717-Prymnesium_polylepis.1